MPIFTNTKAQIIGECDGCPKTNVTLYPSHHGMMLCEGCVEKEKNTLAAKEMIQESRRIDTSTEVKQQLFLAPTVAATELRGAINADDSIPADKKEYAYAKECHARFLHLKQVIKDEDIAQQERRNELRVWQANVQSIAGKLAEEYQKEFADVRIPQYAPTAKPRLTKVSSPVTTKKALDKKTLIDVCAKYNVPAATVQAIVVSRNCSYEDAAKMLVKIIAGEPV